MPPGSSLPRLQGRITEVSVRGFRSLKSIEGLQIPQLAVLIGANGVGKSSFVRLFEMLGWMLRTHKLQDFIVKNGGGDDQLFMGARVTPSLSADIKIETSRGVNDYRFTMEHLSVGDTLMLASEEYRFTAKNRKSGDWKRIDGIGKESALPYKREVAATTIHHLLRQCQTYQFHDTSSKATIHLRWDVEDSIRLRSDGGNLAPVLLNMQQNEPQRYAQLVQQIQRVFPNLDDFVLEPEYGKVLLRWRSRFSEKVFGSHLTSDGSLRLFCLMTLLSLPDSQLPDVMFFDEPELGLHPHAITLVSEMIKAVAQSRQVFISTQSPYMVDCFALENIIVAESNEGATTLHNMPRDKYQRWLDDDYLLSDLWLMNPVGDGA